ncbi:MAG: exo-alpha-sialidase [Armatimonadota bacterium]|nr:MAG: exo-alpha-sialidase [Armatimonadota bacterium]
MGAFPIPRYIFDIMLIAAALIVCCAEARGAASFHRAELIFPLEDYHNHSSCIVEQPNGDLLACWYRGVGPEKGDDVTVMGGRKPQGSDAWSERFAMADTPGYPDNNPCMLVDPEGRLWLFWVTLLANRWQTALLKYRVSRDYETRDGPPVWEWQDVIPVTPADFEEQMNAGLDAYFERYRDLAARAPQGAVKHLRATRDQAGDKLYQRLGWMTRVHPILLPRPTAGGQASARLIVPLYSDNYDVSLMAMTDDWGRTWQTSDALVGVGNVQPSVVRKDDGTLVVMMRENGLQRRIRISESQDDGLTWSPVENMDLPNPGASVEVIRLANGHWALVHNDTALGRHSLAVSISDDEGKTWRWTRHLERSSAGSGSYSYPSLIQARDGTLHATYSYSPGGGRGESIKHAAFNEEWVIEGDGN